MKDAVVTSASPDYNGVVLIVAILAMLAAWAWSCFDKPDKRK
jgi:hypothetical protein